MPEITAKLAAVTDALEGLRTAEADLEAARRQVQKALREAHRAGASYTLLGQLAGLSRQRIAQMVSGK